MKWAFLSLVLLPSFSLHATVTPNSLFSDHLVLQRGVEVPIWGTATSDESVTVTVAGQSVRTQSKDGKWMVKLKPLPVGGPYTMTIQGSNLITISDLLVGDVWIASGQSNMERQLGPREGQKLIDNWEKERDAAYYPQIRQYALTKNYAPAPVYDTYHEWVVCSPKTVSDFTAVGYFFARDLYKTYQVPIGIILTAYGGSPAQNWMSREALEATPELKKLVEAYDKSLQYEPNTVSSLNKRMEPLWAKYRTDSLQAVQEQKSLPKRPVQPYHTQQGSYVSGLYNGMLKPLIPYAIKGVIWYQGENNAHQSKLYQTMFPALIAQWRSEWQQGDFPFLFVQIAPFKMMPPEIREAQLISLKKTKNTAMVVTTDCGDVNDIHPTNKKPVGERLSRAAKVLAYGEKMEYSGPIYESMRVKGNLVILKFSHTGRGLITPDTALKGFTIAGADQKFVPAQARIKGKTVLVFSERVPNPVAVRYGWTQVPDVNLYNKEGLPASPFRTDGCNE
ncbi:sialate O-acetylesterase [Siphonobacter sp. SORGH_AS_0500]|uniref:sialate O-acetylesterase n=1 Tax=Siphonobacter sp. SORGH_AS_0500 TaxID=1864824 RepID=UPI0028659FC0|nr:sialate O-acetylesterase [Siphonobacter sp. SORGH_AS_0500]MDR6194080.1 sialate O-acetylesterase [Siphonobacter sp. SORGH_AS_0500]